MCLAVPGQVVAIDPSSQPLMGTVRFGGIRKTVCFAWTPEVKEGEYVLVHVGFAISRIREDDARETLRLLEQLEEIPEVSDRDQAVES